MQPNMRMIQELMGKMQQQLGEQTVTGSSGGGAVSCEVSGLQEVKSISIKPEAIDIADLSMLEDLVLLAVNDGLTKAKGLAAQQMGSLGLPGLP